MTRPPPRRMLLYALLGLAAVSVLLVGGVLFSQVEDWGRDLSTNHASTDERHSDPRLRPLRSTLSAAETAARVKGAAQGLPRWQFVEQKDQRDGTVELHFLRVTPLMRFTDDIRLRIAPIAEGGSLVSAESQSRVGKGDLGQNPRNLREVLDAVRARLE